MAVGPVPEAALRPGTAPESRAAAGSASLLAGSLWSLLGNAVYSAAQWGMVAALIKLGSPALVGHYALAMAVASPPMTLAGLQLRVVLATDARRRFPFSAYWMLRAPATALALAAVAVLARRAGLTGEAALEAALAALIKAAENCADLYYGVLQRQEKMARIALHYCLKAVLSLACFAALLLATGRLGAALAAVVVCHVFILLAVDRPAARALLEHEPARACWQPHGPALELARTAFPLGLVAALLTAWMAVPRYFIEWRQGPAALGYFAALACFPLALQTALGAVGQASLAPLAFYYSSGHPAFYRLSARLAALAAVVGALALAGSPWSRPLISRLYRADYAEQTGLLGWLMLAGALSAVAGMLGTAATAARLVGPQPMLYAAALTVSALYCLAFVHRGHTAAGAQGLALGALALAAGQALLLGRARRQQASP